MRPDGAVVAMVGERNYAQSQFNRAVQAERQPGSAFKLFDYYAALRQGYTPEDEILDAPIDVHGWQPENYGRHHYGDVSLFEAFADSLNDATVRLSQEVGIDQVIAAARDLGLRASLQNNPSLALGTSEVTLLDLTSAYASVRAGKAPTHPWGISSIKMPSDRDYVPVAPSGESQPSLAKYEAELIRLLKSVVERGTGRAAALGGFAAGKTGNEPGLSRCLVHRFRRLAGCRRLGRQRRSQSDEGRGGWLAAGDDLEGLHGAGGHAGDCRGRSRAAARPRRRGIRKRPPPLPIRAAPRLPQKGRAPSATFWPARNSIIRSAPRTAPINHTGQDRDNTARDDPRGLDIVNLSPCSPRGGTSNTSAALNEVAVPARRAWLRQVPLGTARQASASPGLPVRVAIRTNGNNSSEEMTTASQLRHRGHAFESVKTVIEAILIAVLIRSFLFQPFNIPSGSMEPTLRIGDYLFVSKYSYGYSRYSFPFSLPPFSGRIAATQPQRGDVVVFRHGAVDFIKRVIGLPGDRIQIINGAVYLNGKPIERHRIADFVGSNPCGPSAPGSAPVDVPQWRETLPNGVSYDTLECGAFPAFPDFTHVYTVPAGHFFMMGDNRENSEDSRFPDVGYVPFDDLIGRARLIFFSLSPGWPAWEPWNWPETIRWTRLFSVVR